MATVTFFEKPGCSNNIRQKLLLAAAGHQVIAKDLLTENWKAEQLRLFFGNLPVRKWFNASAPSIKSGEIDPNQLTETQAIELMLASPLLIRRPLMQVDESKMVGFDQAAVALWIGLTEIETSQDMETCPRPQDEAQVQSSRSHE